MSVVPVWSFVLVGGVPFCMAAPRRCAGDVHASMKDRNVFIAHVVRSLGMVM